jgi:hypothetical protein
LALAAALAATAYREVTTAQDNANEASSRGGNSRADMFETRDFYLACYLRCAELRPPRVERGFVFLLLYETIYEPKVEGNQK